MAMCEHECIYSKYVYMCKIMQDLLSPTAIDIICKCLVVNI